MDLNLTETGLGFLFMLCHDTQKGVNAKMKCYIMCFFLCKINVKWEI